MAGLVPAIHVLIAQIKDVDARHKSLPLGRPKAGPEGGACRGEAGRRGYTALSQPKWIGKPSPDSRVAVSYSGKPTTLE